MKSKMAGLMAYLMAYFGLHKVPELTLPPNPSQGFDFRSPLNANDTMWLFWSVNKTEGNIVMEVHAQTHGYISVGLADWGQNTPHDVIVGWVKDGNAYFMDYHTTDEGQLVPDASQDWYLLDGKEDDHWTVLKFTRKLITCDDDDVKIEEGTHRLVYSISDTDPTGYENIDLKQADDTGRKSLMFLSSHLLSALNMNTPDIPDDVIVFEKTFDNFNVPPIHTTYQSLTFRIPKYDRKHHVIKIEPLVTKGNEEFVHHIALSACPRNPYLGPEHENIIFDTIKSIPAAVHHCRDSSYFATSVGTGGISLPKEVGLPFGGEDEPDFFILQLHYDNPNLRTDIYDSSGFRLLLTPTLRKYDGDLVEFGSAINRQMVVPPYQDSFKVKAICSEKFLTKSIPEEGVTVYAGLLHAHLLGSSLEVKVYRKGIEQKPILSDRSYDFELQKLRSVLPVQKLMRGDSLELVCTMNSSMKTKPLYGGFSTRDEMCMSYLWIYPRMPLKFCVSSPLHDGVADDQETAVDTITSWNWKDPLVAEHFQKVSKYGQYYNTGLYVNTTAEYQTFKQREDRRLQYYKEPEICTLHN